MWFWNRKPKQPWIYLGWTEISFCDGPDDPKKRSQTIHYYARGDDLKERRYDYEAKDKYDSWRSHEFIQQWVIPWAEGNNIWGPIRKPSENFKDWTKAKCGFEWKDDRWYKPAQKIEGNVFAFPRKVAE